MHVYVRDSLLPWLAGRGIVDPTIPVTWYRTGSGTVHGDPTHSIGKQTLEPFAASLGELDTEHVCNDMYCVVYGLGIDREFARDISAVQIAESKSRAAVDRQAERRFAAAVNVMWTIEAADAVEREILQLQARTTWHPLALSHATSVIAKLQSWLAELEVAEDVVLDAVCRVAATRILSEDFNRDLEGPLRGSKPLRRLDVRLVDREESLRFGTPHVAVNRWLIIAMEDQIRSGTAPHAAAEAVLEDLAQREIIGRAYYDQVELEQDICFLPAAARRHVMHVAKLLDGWLNDQTEYIVPLWRLDDQVGQLSVAARRRIVWEQPHNGPGFYTFVRVPALMHQMLLKEFKDGYVTRGAMAPDKLTPAIFETALALWDRNDKASAYSTFAASFHAACRL